MKAVIDTNVLIKLLDPSNTDTMVDPKTGEGIPDAERRAAALLEYIDSRSGLAIIPAPALSEVLIGYQDEQEQFSVLEFIEGQSCFEVAPFDEIAAYECAKLLNPHELSQLDTTDTKSKIRFDRQIIAIAKATNADEIWSHDRGLVKVAERVGLTTKSLADIEPKPEQLDWEGTHD